MPLTICPTPPNSTCPLGLNFVVLPPMFTSTIPAALFNEIRVSYVLAFCTIAGAKILPLKLPTLPLICCETFT